MNSDFNPEKITVPPELEGKFFLTTKEFAQLAGVTRECVYGWAKAGHIRLKKYSPRCSMVPIEDVLRYMRGEMMEPRTEEKPARAPLPYEYGRGRGL